MNILVKLKVVLALFVMCLSANSYAQDHAISTKHMELIEKWLSTHAQFRIANLEDCACNESIQEIRIGDNGVYKPQPNYLPYYAVGNFNGFPSFAVLVVKKQKKFQANIVVFSEGNDVPPITIKYPFVTDENLEYVGLFVKHKNNKVDDLLIGTFNSEAEIVSIPRPKKKRQK